MTYLCKLATEDSCPNGSMRCCYHCDDLKTCNAACDIAQGTLVSRSGETCAEKVAASDELELFQTTQLETLKKITDLMIQQKQLEEQAKQLKAGLLKAMEACGITKWENDCITVTYIAPTTRKTIDSVKLKKLHPDIASECEKSSPVSASVRVVVK